MPKSITFLRHVEELTPAAGLAKYAPGQEITLSNEDADRFVGAKQAYLTGSPRPLPSDDVITVDELEDPTSLAYQAVRALAGGGGGSGGTVTWDDATAQKLADLQGYWLVVSDTEPDETTMYGVPVLWIAQNEALTPIPVNPPAPQWDDQTSTFTVPDGVVGVDYVWTVGGVETALTPGATVGTTGAFPRVVTVTAQTRPGYAVLSSPIFGHTFPDPQAVVLLTSDGFSGTAGTELGGRATDVAFGGTSVAWLDQDPAFTLDGAGELVFPAEGGAKAWLPFAGTANYRLKINKTTAGPMQIGHTLSGGLGGSITVYIGSYNVIYADARYVETGGPGGSMVVPGVGGTLSDQIGEWTFQTFESAATVTKPDGTVITYDLDYDDGYQKVKAPRGVEGDHRIFIASEGAAPAVRVSSVEVYEIGF